MNGKAKRATAAAALRVGVARGPSAEPDPLGAVHSDEIQEPELQREGVRTLTLLQRQAALEALAAALGPVPQLNRAQRRALERQQRQRGR